jgi:hypothetical protein
MPPEKSKALVQTLKKIPIFKGLAPSQIQKVLVACEMKLRGLPILAHLG